MHRFCLKKDITFSPVWSTVHLYTTTKNTSFHLMLSKVEIFENTSLLFASGQMKTEVFEYNDVIHHKYVINHISIVFNSVFMWISENDLNTLCVDVYFF